jgi:SAM-dependent methyltransferase
MGIALGGPGCIVGCGDGIDVSYLKSTLHAVVFGADISLIDNYPDDAMILQGDGLCLPLPEWSLKFVFLHHVLEHVSDPGLCLREVHRVLAPDGLLYLGTPNKNRLIGYLGSRTASWPQKVWWNLKDYRDRLLGRFRNEAGAHAGFTRHELVKLISRYFEASHVTALTRDYQVFKYSDRLPRLIMSLVVHPDLVDRLAPAHYLLCRK